MKNWIKGWLQRRRERKASRKNIKYLESLAQQHQWLDQLKKARNSKKTKKDEKLD